MISIKQLTIGYQKNKPVLKSLNLIMNKHQIHGIVGLNGAGKTTLLNALYGLKKVSSGKIDADGKPLTKEELSYLVTENYFYSNITGYEYLSLFKNDSFDTDKWNKLFHLPLDNIIDGYSTGMKKKLAVMGILKQDKPIMILDEPFNGLDIETNRIIRNVLLNLKEAGKTVIITSHIIETLTNLCDYIHYLEDGVIKYSKEQAEFPEFEKEIYDTIEKQNEQIISDLTS